MIINSHVSIIRTLIKEHADDSIYSDEFLYNLLAIERAKLIQQNHDRGVKPNPQEYSTFCIYLEESEYHDCGDCIPESDCKVMKSTSEIPEVLTTRSGLMMKVRKLDGTTISLLNPTMATYSKYSRVKNKLSYWLVNNKIAVQNASPLKVVLVEAVLADPAEISTIPICDSNGNATTDTCFDPSTSDFPIRQSLVSSLHSKVLNNILTSSRFTEDQRNDSNDVNVQIQ